MCARYILAQQHAAERAFGLERISWRYEVRYNVVPTDLVPVVRVTSGTTEGLMLRWGLIPFAAHGVAPKGASLINARVERLEAGYSWRMPWERGQRCILPAGGFYEPHVYEDGSRAPFFVRLVERDVFGFAGLWERSIAADGRVVESCALITVPANELMASVHNEKQRMPAILHVEDHAQWLRGTATQARAALRPYDSELMVAHRVSRRVNSPQNDDASLIEPEPESGERMRTLPLFGSQSDSH
ncbi:MAG TPA: SOS response-associated peptidase [Steroidobacteraceae bacterium]|nr:SOS response-associated peptidase [Steroidobacteraceae bacterium]